MSDNRPSGRPTVEEIESELKRLRAARKKRRIWIIAALAVVIVACAAAYFLQY